MLPLEQLGQQRLALLNRLAGQIPTVKLKQIKRAMDGTGERAMAADQIESGKPVLVATRRTRYRRLLAPLKEADFAAFRDYP